MKVESTAQSPVHRAASSRRRDATSTPRENLRTESQRVREARVVAEAQAGNPSSNAAAHAVGRTTATLNAPAAAAAPRVQPLSPGLSNAPEGESAGAPPSRGDDAPIDTAAPAPLAPPSRGAAPNVDAAAPAEVMTRPEASEAPGALAAPAIENAPAVPGGSDTPHLSTAPPALAVPEQAGAPDVESAAPAPAPGNGIFAPAADLDPQNPTLPVAGRVTLSNGLTYDVAVQVRNNVTLEPGAEELRTLSVSRSQGLGVSVDAGRVSGAYLEGTAASYEVQLPETHYQQVINGTAPFPDPNNLDTLSAGSTLTLREEAFTTVEGQGNLGILQLGATDTRASGETVRIEAGEESVRVLRGPHDVVGQGAGIGLGLSGTRNGVDLALTVGISGERTYTDTSYAFADIAREGGQGTYAAFLATGEVPAGGDESVLSAGTVRTLDDEQTLRLGIGVTGGPVSGQDLLSEGQVFSRGSVEVAYNDGRIERSGAVSQAGITGFARQVFDAEGELVHQERGLLLDNVPESQRALLADALGVPPTERGDFELRLDDQSYGAFRERVVGALGPHHQVRDNPEIIAALREGPDAGGIFHTASGQGYALTFNPVFDAVLRHSSLDTFLTDPQFRAGGVPEVAARLNDLYAEGGVIPGAHLGR